MQRSAILFGGKLILNHEKNHFLDNWRKVSLFKIQGMSKYVTAAEAMIRIAHPNHQEGIDRAYYELLNSI